jgi:hypothetical protein
VGSRSLLEGNWNKCFPIELIKDTFLWLLERMDHAGHEYGVKRVRVVGHTRTGNSLFAWTMRGEPMGGHDHVLIEVRPEQWGREYFWKDGQSDGIY